MANLTEAETAELAALQSRAGGGTAGTSPSAATSAASPAPAPSAAAAPTAPTATPTLTNGGFDTPSDAPQGAPEGPLDLTMKEGPGAIVRGVVSAVAETGHAVADLVGHTSTQREKLTGQKGGYGAENLIAPLAGAAAWLGDKAADWIGKPETVAGNLIQGVAQFATGMVGVSKFIAIPTATIKSTALKLGLQGTEKVLQNGAAAALAFGGHEQRLSDLVDQYPALKNPVTDYLSSKPDDSEAEGRFKNALEGMVVGPLADAFILGAKALKQMAMGKVKEGLASSSEAGKIMQTLKDEHEARVSTGEQQSVTDEVLRSLDPSQDVPGVPRDLTKVAPKDGEAPVPGQKVVTEGAPADPAPAPGMESQAPADHSDVPAPYATDIRTSPTAGEAGSITSTKKMATVTEADTSGAIEALNAKFTVAGEEMVKTGKFPIGVINGDDDLRASLTAMAAASDRHIDLELKGNKDGVYTHEMVLKNSAEFSDVIGVSSDNIILMMSQMHNDARTMDHLGARLLTYKAFVMGTVDDAAEAAAKYNSAKGTVEGAALQAQAAHAAHIAMRSISMVRGIEANSGRLLGSQRIAANALKHEGDYETIVKALESGKFNPNDDALMTHLASFKGNTKGFRKYLDTSFGDKMAGAFNHWYLNSLLSGPITHVANFISNTASLVYHPMERAVAGMMPASEVGAGTAVRRMLDEYQGMSMSLFDSMKAAGEALKSNSSILDPHTSGKLDASGNPIEGLSARALGLTHDYYDRAGTLIRTETTPLLSHFADGINAVTGISGRLLTGGDELAKQMAYRGYLYSKAAEEARTAGFTGDKFSEFVAARINAGFDSDGGALNTVGRQIARETTFTQDLEYGISKWIQGATNEHTWAKLVVPFVKTPTNLFRFSWKHTPGINFFEQSVRRSWAEGGEAKAKVQAQMATGAAMYTLAGTLAYNGVVTGGFSLNPETRKAQEATGAKEYSIKVGDKFYQYNRMDPYGMILGLAADFTNLSSHISQGELDKVAYGMSLSLVKNLSSKTYLQGLTNVFNSLGDVLAGRSTTGLDTWLYRTAGSVAVPSIVKSMTGSTDDTLLEARSVMDSIKARVHSKDVPPVRNILGKVVEAPKGWGSDMVSPIGLGVDNHDPVYAELARQMTAADHPLSRIMPKLGETDIDLREVTLKSGQNAYDRMQQLLHDSGVHDTLAKTFTSPSWANRQDGSSDYPNAPGTKLFMTNRILTQYKEMAKVKLLSQNPELMQMYRQESQRMLMTGVQGDSPRHYQPPTFLQSVTGPAPNDLRKPAPR